jgi:hypothetical protein
MDPDSLPLGLAALYDRQGRRGSAIIILTGKMINKMMAVLFDSLKLSIALPSFDKVMKNL